MPGNDPNLIRQAVAQFQPRRRPRFGNLEPCRDVIVELRQKGASCEAIAELLTRYGVKTSRTMINEFVRTLRGRKGKSRQVVPMNSAVAPKAPAFQSTSPISTEGKMAKARGPHIAKVELLNPGEKYD